MALATEPAPTDIDMASALQSLHLPTPTHMATTCPSTQSGWQTWRCRQQEAHRHARNKMLEEEEEDTAEGNRVSTMGGRLQVATNELRTYRHGHNVSVHPVRQLLRAPQSPRRTARGRLLHTHHLQPPDARSTQQEKHNNTGSRQVPRQQLAASAGWSIHAEHLPPTHTSSKQHTTVAIAVTNVCLTVAATCYIKLCVCTSHACYECFAWPHAHWEGAIRSTSCRSDPGDTPLS